MHVKWVHKTTFRDILIEEGRRGSSEAYIYHLGRLERTDRRALKRRQLSRTAFALPELEIRYGRLKSVVPPKNRPSAKRRREKKKEGGGEGGAQELWDISGADKDNWHRTTPQMGNIKEPGSGGDLSVIKPNASKETISRVHYRPRSRGGCTRGGLSSHNELHLRGAGLRSILCTNFPRKTRGWNWGKASETPIGSNPRVITVASFLSAHLSNGHFMIMASH